MKSQSIKQSRSPRSSRRDRLQAALGLLSNPAHQQTRLDIARTYRDMLSTLTDPYSRQLLDAANRLLAESEGTAKQATA